jgi:tRNA1Val (adenine37-N6)-methyltransferase
MPNTYFRFRQFTVHQNRAAMKVCTDACLFGAWVAAEAGGKGIQRILDIGSGTGLLSLMLAQATGGIIDAVEIDDHAYRQTAENFAASPWADKLKVHHCAIQEFSPPFLYDLIICNPPFYENELRSPDSKKNVAMHSTQLNLDDLLRNMKRLLTPGGTTAMLIPYIRMAEIEGKIKSVNLFIQKKILVKQTERHVPFRCMYTLQDVFSDYAERKITVKDDEFNSLLKSYYL